MIKMQKWEIISSKIKGRHHETKKSGINCCQDYCCSKINKKDNVYVICVSDGCGSKPLSQFGSKNTCEVICDLFSKKYDYITNLNNFEVRKLIIDSIINQNMKQRFLAKKLKKIHITDEEEAIKSFSSTCLFTAVKDNMFIFGMIGDGYIGIKRKDRNGFEVFMEENKDGDEMNMTCYPQNIYLNAINNQVWYLDKRFQLRKVKSDTIESIVLSTDGCNDGLINRHTNLYCNAINKISELIQHTNARVAEKELKKLIKLLKERSQVGDDCTISMMATID